MPCRMRVVSLLAIFCASQLCLATIRTQDPLNDEAYIFTPAGFDRPGEVVTLANESNAGVLKINVRDTATGKPTFCRINVIGPDGNFYQPAPNYLSPFGLTGQWPENGKGNRKGKGPYRYFGRYFYSWGEAEVRVPPGKVRIEVWKGLEYRPVTKEVAVETGAKRVADFEIARMVAMADHGYYSGDPHIHVTRASAEDESLIFDLMEAEDIHFGSILAYNEPAGPYAGLMDDMDMPQRRGLGRKSILTRDSYSILSGQEYRSQTFGHLNLFLRDDLVRDGEKFDADNGPPYGMVGRETKAAGGFAFYAHGGYAQAIYADLIQGDVDGVELLQFGVYRGIGLEDWYHVLNMGYRFPAVGACDFPACRKLGDCVTYVEVRGQGPGVRDQGGDEASVGREPHDSSSAFEDWLRGAAEGRSFVTTGPMLLLDVDGAKPGDAVNRSGQGPHTLKATLRVRCEVAPVTDVQFLVNGEIVSHHKIEPNAARNQWHSIEVPVSVDRSAWIAARVFSVSPNGNPDAESHTNPVYVYVDNKAPYDQASLDAILAKLDGQIAVQKKRDFSGKAQVLAYFERSRDLLLKIRERGGMQAGWSPSEFARVELPALVDPGSRTHTEEELREFLKPVPPKTPQQALATFETIPGFHMELVAHEPLVVDPIAAAFDELGQLYVCEMRDYPYFPQPGEKPLGTLRLLRDTNGDGTFDDSSIFADELLWAGGVVPWKEGVFVAAPPDIWYMRDTDGDFRADVRRKVFTGFGTKNQQAMLNNLQFGLDHWIYGSTAGNGGTIRHADRPDSEGVSVDGRDFRFDPVTEKFEAITGTVQFGNTFDDWGNRFLCSESSPLHHVVLPQHYLECNPYLPVPRAIQNIAGGSVPIFRISPLERWREIRSSRRIAHGERGANSAGASHHVIDAAAGVTIYRGGAYPAEFRGNVFVGDAQNNLIHRRRLIENGVTFDSERADADTEFVRSSDNWFRPVNFVHAPDGTLYVLDMSREILESIHIPSDVVKFLDLKNGRDTGRIYRIAPDGFRIPPPVQLDRASTAELVEALASPHAWFVDTASRLLFERQDQTAVPELRRLFGSSEESVIRLRALWALQGLGALDQSDVVAALHDNTPQVREHGLRLAESFIESQKVRELMLNAATDPHPRVRFQAAFSLGTSNDERTTAALAGITKQDIGDPWIPIAVLSSSSRCADRLLEILLRDRDFTQQAASASFLEQLVKIVGLRGEPGEVGHVLSILAADSHEAVSPATRALVLALGTGLRSGGRSLNSNANTPDSAAAFLSRLTEEASRVAEDVQSQEAERTQAIQLLGCCDYAKSGPTLASLLTPTHSTAIQIAAISALAGYSNPAIADFVIADWRGLAPEVRVRALQTLLSRDAWTIALLQAVEQGHVDASVFDDRQRTGLVEHRSGAVRNLAKNLIAKVANSPRTEVVEQYREALGSAGNAERGSVIFERDCATCHRIGTRGVAVGPDLTSSAVRDPEALLAHVFDPNRYVLPNYVQYVAVDTTGRTFTGLIAEQTATSITLKREKGETDVLLRANLDELAATGKSLMPEGFEKKISVAEMTDLLAFLASVQVAPNQGRLEIGTEPGLVEPD